MMQKQLEIFMQCYLNFALVNLPAILVCNRSVADGYPIEGLEMVGFGFWLFAYVIETADDLQKKKFIQNCPREQRSTAICNEGLWYYSRHPNYFGEWLVWTGLVIATVPSWLALREFEAGWVWIGLGLGAVGASAMLYITLVYLTGAKPAEYYSAQNRPGYRAYQATTNMFFPWFPKTPSPE